MLPYWKTVLTSMIIRGPEFPVECFSSPSRLSFLQYATESESNLQQVRALLASAQRDKMELANQLEEEKRYNPKLQCAPAHVCDAFSSK